MTPTPPVGAAPGERRKDMTNFDYEIRGYVVEWKTEGKHFKREEFKNEDAAATFAKEISKTADSITLIQERYAIGWY